jgi:hypothetical protein
MTKKSGIDETLIEFMEQHPTIKLAVEKNHTTPLSLSISECTAAKRISNVQYAEN